MKRFWPLLGLLLPLTGTSKDHPTAECNWLYQRLAALEKAIQQGDELGTREALAKRKKEFKAKACSQYDY